MSKIEDSVSAIFERIDGGEVFAEDVNDVLTLLGFHNETQRHLMRPKVLNTIENIVQSRTIAEALMDDPRRGFYKYVNDGKYTSEYADTLREQYAVAAENEYKFLIGLQALGSK